MVRVLFDTGARVQVTSSRGGKRAEEMLSLKVDDKEIEMTVDTANVVRKALDEALEALRRVDPLG